jgi:hypothetical protein
MDCQDGCTREFRYWSFIEVKGIMNFSIMRSNGTVVTIYNCNPDRSRESTFHSLAYLRVSLPANCFSTTIFVWVEVAPDEKKGFHPAKPKSSLHIPFPDTTFHSQA